MNRHAHLKCPSYLPELPHSEAFAVVTGTSDEPEVAYLQKTLPVDDKLLAMTEPVDPTEVFRFAGPCAGPDCRHFDRATRRCTLVARAVEMLPVEVMKAPPCAIRKDCVWWNQEGRAACVRCPQVVSLNHRPNEEFARAATPTARERNGRTAPR